MITGIHNAQVQRVIQYLNKGKKRKTDGVFVVEGIKMITEAPSASVVQLFVSASFARRMEGERHRVPPVRGRRGEEKILSPMKRKEENRVFLLPVKPEVVSDEVFARMSDTQSPQGVLAVLKQPGYTLEQILDGGKKAPLLLLLEHLQDPGNLGTILRSAEGAGVSGVILSADSVDLFNPKVVRSTMGAIFRLPFFYAENFSQTICEIKKKGIRIFAADLEGSRDYDLEDYTAPSAFLIGNESRGLSEEAKALADRRIFIPMEGKLESLNAAVSAAVLVYEGARQRRRVRDLTTMQ